MTDRTTLGGRSRELNMAPEDVRLLQNAINKEGSTMTAQTVLRKIRQENPKIAHQVFLGADLEKPPFRRQLEVRAGRMISQVRGMSYDSIREMVSQQFGIPQ